MFVRILPTNAIFRSSFAVVRRIWAKIAQDAQLGVANLNFELPLALGGSLPRGVWSLILDQNADGEVVKTAVIKVGSSRRGLFSQPSCRPHPFSQKSNSQTCGHKHTQTHTKQGFWTHPGTGLRECTHRAPTLAPG